MKKAKGHLSGLRQSLETSRKKWCAEKNASEAKRKQATEATVARLLCNEERRKAFEARLNEMKALNIMKLDEGTFEGPIVPIGLGTLEPLEKNMRRRLSYCPAGICWLSRRLSVHRKQVRAAPVAVVLMLSVSRPCRRLRPPLARVTRLRRGLQQVRKSVRRLSQAEVVKQTIAEAHVRLQKERYVALEEEFINVAKPQDLRLQDRALFEAVRGFNIGVCARCRYKSGCPSCDEKKAWSYACRSTLWHTANEDLRPKAKPKGRPQHTA